MRQEAASKPACPKCGSTDIRRSRGEGLIALLARMFSRWPYRCRSCRVKFYRYSNPPPDHGHN